MSMESTNVPVSKFFEDMALLTMAEWQSVSQQELMSEYTIELHSLHPTATDLAAASLGENASAVRYSWTLAGSVKLIDVHVFIFPEGDESVVIQRHYRVRATEWI